jgi:hypothetical protein
MRLHALGRPCALILTVLFSLLFMAKTTQGETLPMNEHLSRVPESIEQLRSDAKWEESRRRLDDVYRAKEFRHFQQAKVPLWPPFFRELFQRVMKWVGEHLGGVGSIPAEWALYVTYALLLLASFAVLIWILRSFGFVTWRRRPSHIKGLPLPGPSEVDYHALREEALKRAMEGAFRDAIRSFFVSVLWEGHHRGWWRYAPEATNREHLASVKGPAERHEALGRLMDLYERVWYGQGHPGKESFQECQEWLRRMEVAL